MLLYRIAQTVLPDTYIIKEDVIYICTRIQYLRTVMFIKTVNFDNTITGGIN